MLTKSEFKILVADDEELVCDLLVKLLSERYAIDTIRRGDKVLDKLKSSNYTILLLDLQLPGRNGLDILQTIHDEKLHVEVVILTASNDVEKATRAMKLGAYDYIVKPFDNERLLIVLEKIREKLELESEVTNLREEIGKNLQFSSMIGSSSKMQHVYKTLSKVIYTDSTILISGESGTGKGVLARAIHYNSQRNELPFRALDCSTIPHDLLASELFGHEKGAFTGAHARMIGKFEAVANGTLFLDEISNLSIDVQSKLLRVLQEKEFERIGGNSLIKVRARIIAATNRDLLTMVEDGTFREDLYYRFNVVPIELPPLRERKEDIPLFIEYFLSRYNGEYQKKISISVEGKIYLSEYSWPGNVRQLENVIRRVVLLADDSKVELADLYKILAIEDRQKVVAQESVQDLTLRSAIKIVEPSGELKAFETIEKEIVEKALELHSYNISKTAQELGLSRKTLHNKINKFAISIIKSAI